MLTISTIPEALIELENQTGRVWTDSELFDVATKCNIELHAAPPITAQTSLQEFVDGQGLVEKMRMPAGHAALAVLFPWQVGQLWLSHETVTSHPSDHDKHTGKYKVFTEPVKVTREQVRIKSATLKKILQIWKSAQTDKELRHRYPEWMFTQESTKTLAKDFIQQKNTAKTTMKTITLATGTTHVPFNEVAHLIAYAIHPDIDDEDDNPSSYHFALIGLETELKRAAKFGQLPVKNKLTLGAHELPIGDALNHVLVTVNDLRSFVADRGIQVAVEATQSKSIEDMNLLNSEFEQKTKEVSDATPPKLGELYLLMDVSIWMAKQEKWDTDKRESFLKELMLAANEGKLIVRNPETGISRIPKNVLSFDEYTKPEHINEWLDKDGSHLRWKTEALETRAIDKASITKPLQRTAAQDKAISMEIEKMGMNPKELPKNIAGKPGVKAEIRKALSSNSLFVGATVFDKAWVRMSDAGDIALK